MKKLFFVLLFVGLFSIIVKADPCGPKAIPVGSEKLELINVTAKPEKTANGQSIKGGDEVLVAGIYMFVRNGQTWNTYRCADEIKRDKNKNPVLDLNNCVIKNDFEFGNLVKRYGNSGITVRKTDSNRLQIRLNAAGTEDLDYYDVKSTSEGLEVIKNKFKENKQQRYLSQHVAESLGTCNKNTAASAQGARSVRPAATGSGR